MRGLNWLTGRGRQEKRPGERPSPDVTPPRTVANDGWRPAQTGRSLLQADEHRRLIRVLTENSPLSQQVTEAWWLRPLEEMAGRVQACPAAWSGPFSGPGGFNELSLNVATRSVRLVRGMMLPQGATPEEQAEQTPGWVCAAYWAGLRPRLEQLYLMSVQKGAKKGEQLFNINRFTPKKKRITRAKNMDHLPMRAFFRRLSRECQCDISPHRFRHTIATDLMKRPERSLNDVQMLLGHSSVAVTLEYVEANMNNLRRNLEAAYAA